MKLGWVRVDSLAAALTMDLCGGVAAILTYTIGLPFAEGIAGIVGGVFVAVAFMVAYYAPSRCGTCNHEKAEHWGHIRFTRGPCKLCGCEQYVRSGKHTKAPSKPRDAA